LENFVKKQSDFHQIETFIMEHFTCFFLQATNGSRDELVEQNLCKIVNM